MFRTARIPTAASSGGNLCLQILSAALVALCGALAAPAALAGSDYPPGLFENSPVVGPGGQAPANPAAPQADAEPGPAGPGPAGPADPYANEPGPVGPAGPYDAQPGPPYPGGPAPPYAADAAPPYAEAERPPAPMAPTAEFCDGIGMRTFGSLEDVRRAHAVCDHRQRPRPGY